MSRLGSGAGHHDHNESLRRFRFRAAIRAGRKPVFFSGHVNIQKQNQRKRVGFAVDVLSPSGQVLHRVIVARAMDEGIDDVRFPPAPSETKSASASESSTIMMSSLSGANMPHLKQIFRRNASNWSGQ